MIENAEKMGERFVSGLKGFNHEIIREVRGRGLLIALELRHDAGGARRVTEALMRRGLLCKETHQHTIRFAPPLVITAGEVDWALEQISGALG
jgi:ornithine--oxo-acid transaminase